MADNKIIRGNYLLNYPKNTISSADNTLADSPTPTTKSNTCKVLLTTNFSRVIIQSNAVIDSITNAILRQALGGKFNWNSDRNLAKIWK